MTSGNTAAASRTRWAHWAATSFGLGDLVPAPGTVAGSLPAAVLWGLVALLPWSQVRCSLTAVLTVSAIVVGIWAADLEATRRQRHDPGPVVIDEVAGQLVTFLVALPFLDLTGPLSVLVAGSVGFVLFRLFDIVKPWPARRLERLPGGLGIVADDLAAGIEAGWVLALIASRSAWL